MIIVGTIFDEDGLDIERPDFEPVIIEIPSEVLRGIWKKQLQ